MAEKRRQRQAKQRGKASSNAYADFPKAKLDVQNSAPSSVLDSPEKLSDPTEAAGKAQELLESQRASVDTLSTVKERVLALPTEDVASALENQGYYVVDEFVGDEHILKQMESEAQNMYDNGEFELDMANLGGGEYTVTVKGGQEQYVKCPRVVEWVVSLTKHVPELLDNHMSLDSSACMATLRTFDRKALQASLALLTGSEEVPEATKPFGKTVADTNEDKRRLSLQYYLVSDLWEDACGGGISFENLGSVEAKRDRLVVWKSDSSSLRKEIWKGTDDLSIGSSVELHLVQK